MRVFLDSSGFAKRFLQEAGSARVDEICSEASSLGLSILCASEVCSALCRLRSESRLTRAQYRSLKERLFADLADTLLVQVTEEAVKRSIAVLESSSLKTLDALQVASVLELKPELFVTADRKQGAAAKRLGLRVEVV